MEDVYMKACRVMSTYEPAHQQMVHRYVDLARRELERRMKANRFMSKQYRESMSELRALYKMYSLHLDRMERVFFCPRWYLVNGCLKRSSGRSACEERN